MISVAFLSPTLPLSQSSSRPTKLINSAPSFVPKKKYSVEVQSKERPGESYQIIHPSIHPFFFLHIFPFWTVSTRPHSLRGEVSGVDRHKAYCAVLWSPTRSSNFPKLLCSLYSLPTWTWTREERQREREDLKPISVSVVCVCKVGKESWTKRLDM